MPSYKRIRNAIKRGYTDVFKRILDEEGCVFTSPEESLLEIALECRRYDYVMDILQHPEFNPNCRPFESLNLICETPISGSRRFAAYAETFLKNPRLNLYVFGPQLLLMMKSKGWRGCIKILNDRGVSNDTFLVVDNVETAKRLHKECETIVNGGVDCISFMTSGILCIKEFLQLGFIPVEYSSQEAAIQQKIKAEAILKDIDEPSRRFWGEYTTFNGHYEWHYCSKKFRIQVAVRSCDTYPLLTLPDYEDLIYPSFRPKTDMKLYQMKKYKTYTNVKPTETLFWKAFVDGEYVDCVPCCRYSEGMSRGLYFQMPGRYSGTFYYYEPDSTTFLKCNPEKTEIYENKYQAILCLINNMKDLVEMSSYQKEYLEGISSLPKDLMMTPSELCEFVQKEDYKSLNILFKHGNKKWKDFASDEKRYVGKHLELYALEDSWDRILYHTGWKNNIEMFIFTDMVGGRQKVTEIFDLRKRCESFDNLLYQR